MGPGPGNPYPEVIEAFARPMLGHLDPEFLALLDETCDRLRTVFRTDNALTLPISGTGSAGMEACIRQRRRPGRRGRRSASTACSASACATWPRAAAPRSSGSTSPGASRSTAERLLDAHPSPTLIARRARRDLHRRAHRRRAASAPARATPSCSSTASRRSAASPSTIDGWGDRPRLQRHAEVPRRAARPRRRSPCRERARERFVERSQSWYLDLRMIGSYVGGSRRHADLPPHRPDLDDLRAARRARRAARRGPRGASRPATPSAAGCCRTGLEQLGLRAVRHRGAPPARAHHRWSCPTASTRPRSGPRCSSATASRSAAASATTPARCGASGCMGHTARPRNVTLLLGALREVLGR